MGAFGGAEDRHRDPWVSRWVALIDRVVVVSRNRILWSARNYLGDSRDNMSVGLPMRVKEASTRLHITSRDWVVYG